MSSQKRYISRPQLRRRYADVSDMWVWRRQRDDPHFPKPMMIAGRAFYDVDELDAYDQKMKGAEVSADAA